MQLRFTGTTRLLATLFFIWPATALAEIPNGIMVFEFDGVNQIYDLSTISDCESLDVDGISVTLCLDVDMVSDGKGKHTGTASLAFSGDIQGTLIGPAAASAKGKADRSGAAKLKFATTGRLNGFDTKLGLSCKGPISMDGMLDSICKVKVKIDNVGSASAVASFSDQLNGGPWMITINVTPVDEKKFEGSATDSLGYAYAVKGSYSAKKGLSKLKATGDKTTAAKGAKIQLKSLTEFGGAEAKYKVQGYSGVTAVEAD
jgi:hypothetical protein